LRFNVGLLPTTNFVARTSGIRVNLLDNDLVIQFNDKLYFWKWKSGNQAPYFDKSLPAGFRNFKTLQDTQQVFFIMTNSSFKYFNPFEPSKVIFELNNIHIKPFDFCSSPCSDFMDMNLLHQKSDGSSWGFYYEEANVKCPTGTVCFSDGNPASCPFPKILQENSCVDILYCPGGNNLFGRCDKCHTFCLTCGDTTATSCLSCPQGTSIKFHYPDMLECLTTGCLPGYYMTVGNICLKCYSTCKNCLEAGAGGCTECD
jgi:hypothetical protein